MEIWLLYTELPFYFISAYCMCKITDCSPSVALQCIFPLYPIHQCKMCTTDHGQYSRNNLFTSNSCSKWHRKFLLKNVFFILVHETTEEEFLRCFFILLFLLVTQSIVIELHMKPPRYSFRISLILELFEIGKWVFQRSPRLLLHDVI